MIGFTAGARLGVTRWNDFQGRSSRSEFWWFHLFVLLSLCIAFFIINISGFPRASKYGIALLIILATSVPIISINIRRLHDIGTSAWSLLFTALPVVGLIFLIFYGNKKGDNGVNRFGVEPEINYFFHGVAHYSDSNDEIDNHDVDYINLSEKEILEKHRLESIKRLQKSKNLEDSDFN